MNCRRTPVILLLLLLGLLPACHKRGPAPSPVLLRVDARKVTLEQFRKGFASSHPTERDLSADEKRKLQRAFLVQLIDRELTLAEADRLGVKVTPAELEAAVRGDRRDYPAGTFDRMLRRQGLTPEAWRARLRQELLTEKVIRREVYAGVTVSDREIRDYFRGHPEEFHRPDQVRARQILVATRAQGRRVLALLRKGEPFAEAARRYSLSPDAEQGGDLGFFARGQMPPEFDAVVFHLPVGKISDLVKSRYGYHIFKVEKRRKAVRLTLDAVREKIRRKLTGEKQERAYQRWLQSLWSRADIEVNRNLL